MKKKLSYIISIVKEKYAKWRLNHPSLRRHRKALTAVGIALLVLIVMLLAFLHVCNRTAMSRPESKVGIEIKQYYTVAINGKAAFYFSSVNADSTLGGVTLNKDGIHYIPMQQQGQLYNQLSLLPTCWGHLTTAIPKECHNFSHLSLPRQSAAIIGREQLALDTLLKRQDFELDELTYYLRIHSVQDEGFHMIVKFKQRLDSINKTLRTVDSLLSSKKGKQRVTITLNNDFTAVYRDSSGRVVREACTVKRYKNGKVYLRLASHSTPSGKSLFVWPWKKMPVEKARPRNGYYNVTDSLGRPVYGFFVNNVLQRGVRRDSAGIYVGEMTPHGIASGHGWRRDYDGSYYEGNWQNDMREDYGFALNPGRSMRAGEWKQDVYKGERLTYTSNRIYGIDISKYQHEKGKRRYGIDWSHLRITHLGHQSKKRINGTVDYPISFIFIKSTEGTTVRNKYFAADYRQAHAAGLHVGAYHFFSTRTRGSDQARFFLRCTALRKGDLPPVLDIEPLPSQIKATGGPQVMWTNVRAWLRVVEAATGTKPILYISQTFVNRYLPLAPDIKKKYRVWIARYGEYKPDIRLAIWQLCQDGQVSGIRGYVDINVFNGYKEEYSEFLRDRIK